MSADRDHDPSRSGASEVTHAAPGQPDRAGAATSTVLPDPDEGLFGGAISVAGHRAAGRPLGSLNIRTNKTFQVAVSRYGDPLITSVALGNMNTLELIRELRTIASDAGIKLGMSVGDVLAFQRACRADALPYGHAKRAPTNEKGETITPIIGIGTYVASENTIVAGAISIEDNLELDQQLSADDAVMSHD